MRSVSDGELCMCACHTNHSVGCIKERINLPVRNSDCGILHVIDLALWRENYIRKVFCKTLESLQCTWAQHKSQHLFKDLF